MLVNQPSSSSYSNPVNNISKIGKISVKLKVLHFWHIVCLGLWSNQETSKSAGAEKHRNKMRKQRKNTTLSCVLVSA